MPLHYGSCKAVLKCTETSLPCVVVSEAWNGMELSWSNGLERRSHRGAPPLAHADLHRPLAFPAALHLCCCLKHCLSFFLAVLSGTPSFCPSTAAPSLTEEKGKFIVYLIILWRIIISPHFLLFYFAFVQYLSFISHDNVLFMNSRPCGSTPLQIG